MQKRTKNERVKMVRFCICLIYIVLDKHILNILNICLSTQSQIFTLSENICKNEQKTSQKRSKNEPKTRQKRAKNTLKTSKKRTENERVKTVKFLFFFPFFNSPKSEKSVMKNLNCDETMGFLFFSNFSFSNLRS